MVVLECDCREPQKTGCRLQGIASHGYRLRIQCTQVVIGWQYRGLGADDL